MSFAAKYQYEYESPDGSSYRASLLFDGYVGSAAAIEGAGASPLVLAWEPEGDGDHFVYTSSYGDFSFYDPDGVIAADIYDAGEAMVRLQLERDSGSGYAVEWVGPVVADFDGARTTDAYGGVTTVSADDGVGGLQHTDAEDVLTLFGTLTAVEALTTILEATGLGLPIRTACGWYHDGAGVVFTANDDPLDNTYISPALFDVLSAYGDVDGTTVTSGTNSAGSITVSITGFNTDGAIYYAERRRGRQFTPSRSNRAVQMGARFTIAGNAQEYEVLGNTLVMGGAATVGIKPPLVATAAAGSAVTWVAGEDRATALDVLYFILEAFSLRLYQRGGRWVVEQREQIASSFETWEYDSDYHTTGAAPAQATRNPLVTLPADEELHRHAGGAERRIRALGSASLVYTHGAASKDLIENYSLDGPYTTTAAGDIADGWTMQGSLILAQGVGGGQFIYARENTQVDPTVTADAFDDVGGSVGTETFVVTTGQGSLVRVRLDFSGQDGLTGEFHIFFSARTEGNLYLQQDGTWSSTVAAVGHKTGSSITFDSTEMLPEGGDLFFQIYGPVEAASGTPSATSGVRFHGAHVYLMPGGMYGGIATKITATGDAGEDLELDEAVFGDGPREDVLAAVLAADGTPARNWTRGLPGGTPSGLALSMLRLESLVNRRRTSRRVREETFALSADLPALGVGDAVEMEGRRFTGERVPAWDTLQGIVDVELVELDRSVEAVAYTYEVLE